MAAQMGAMTPVEFDWRAPDYTSVFDARVARLQWLRAVPGRVESVKAYYTDHPAAFIGDWGQTFDPRLAEIDRPTTVPFVLFTRQAEFVDWLYARWRAREDGLAEKSRDMGVSWLCCAFSVWMWLFHAGTVVGIGSRKEEYVDKIGDPKSLFWKIRQFIDLLPVEFQPRGWDPGRHTPHMRVLNPENGSSIIGEAGDNIGRGNRTSIYFSDEAAFFEHPDAIDAALSQTSNCKIDVSTPSGAGNSFYRKRHGGKIPVFVFDWREDPRKGPEWYARQVELLDPVIVAQEIDRDYESSIADSFIPGDLVTQAQSLGPADIRPMGRLRVGVDVARFGDDKSVISFRRGRVLLKQVVLAKLDVTQVAARAKAEIDAYNDPPEQIAVDTIGIGAGVADVMRGWYPDKVSGNQKIRVVVDVNSSLRMSNGRDYNLRAFMWSEMREWLKGASIPKDQDLKSDLTALRYHFKAGEMMMEDKQEAKRRGIKSPDRGDSLALTFAIPTQVRVERARPQVPYVPHDEAVGM